MCVERSLDPPMAPSTIIILSSGNLGDVDQKLEHETRQGEQPGFCSGRRIRKPLLLNQVTYLWKPETLKTQRWMPTLLNPFSMPVNFVSILSKLSTVKMCTRDINTKMCRKPLRRSALPPPREIFLSP